MKATVCDECKRGAHDVCKGVGANAPLCLLPEGTEAQAPCNCGCSFRLKPSKAQSDDKVRFAGSAMPWRDRTDPWCIAMRNAGISDAQAADWLAKNLAECLTREVETALRMNPRMPMTVPSCPSRIAKAGDRGTGMWPGAPMSVDCDDPNGCGAKMGHACIITLAPSIALHI